MMMMMMAHPRPLTTRQTLTCSRRPVFGATRTRARARQHRQLVVGAEDVVVLGVVVGAVAAVAAVAEAVAVVPAKQPVQNDGIAAVAPTRRLPEPPSGDP